MNPISSNDVPATTDGVAPASDSAAEGKKPVKKRVAKPKAVAQDAPVPAAVEAVEDAPKKRVIRARKVAASDDVAPPPVEVAAVAVAAAPETAPKKTRKPKTIATAPEAAIDVVETQPTQPKTLKVKSPSAQPEAVAAKAVEAAAPKAGCGSPLSSPTGPASATAVAPPDNTRGRHSRLREAPAGIPYGMRRSSRTTPAIDRGYS